MSAIRDASASRHRSVAVDAYKAICSRIADGSLEPGERLIVKSLETMLDMSATPIKTALAQLERDGLVQLQHFSGYTVRELSVHDAREIYELREALDGAAAQCAARNTGRALIAAQLRVSYLAQRDYIDSDDIEGYREKDIAYHKQLWELCGNSRVFSVGEDLLNQMRLANFFSARHPGRGRAGVAEHLRIIELIEAGAVDEVGDLARQHVRNSREAFEQSMTESRRGLQE